MFFTFFKSYKWYQTAQSVLDYLLIYFQISRRFLWTHKSQLWGRGILLQVCWGNNSVIEGKIIIPCPCVVFIAKCLQSINDSSLTQVRILLTACLSLGCWEPQAIVPNRNHLANIYLFKVNIRNTRNV